MTIYLDEIEFKIIHRTNKRIKQISLVMESHNVIMVKTPLKYGVHNIHKLIIKHKNWILGNIHKMPKKYVFDFANNGSILYLGTEYASESIVDNSIVNAKFVLKDSIFYIYHSADCSYDDFVYGLLVFYKRNAKAVIDPLFEKWSKITELYPSKISYRKAKRRWGSCSFINNISINYMLLQFDIGAIEYVVLHELCHIKEKNHSKRFWQIVSKYMPEYKKKEETLKSRIL